MQAAQVGLIGMKINWPQPFTRDAAASDRLKIPGRWLGLDGFLLDQFVAEFRIPKVADRLLARQEE